MLPSIHLKLRKDKEIKGKCPIIIQIHYNKQRKQIFTGLAVEAKYWNEEKEQVTAKAQNGEWFNRLLKNKMEEVQKEYFKQSLTSGTINLKKDNKISREDFFSYANGFYEGKSNTAGLLYINKAKTAIRDFKDFAGLLSMQSVTVQVLKEFENHLFKKGLQRNTINGKFKRLKQPFKQAVQQGLVTNNPFDTFSEVTYKQPKRDYLTMDEVNMIASAELPDEIEHIRNYFLLSCYTGMRFGDLQKFDKAKSIITNNGVERIIISTQKTGSVISLKINENLRNIIDRIKKPLPSNIHANRLLKIIAKVAGINKPISMHQGRHSFAVNSASLGIPIEAVSRLLGHTDIRTTAIYFKLTDTKLDEYMDKWNLS